MRHYLLPPVKISKANCVLTSSCAFLLLSSWTVYAQHSLPDKQVISSHSASHPLGRSATPATDSRRTASTVPSSIAFQTATGDTFYTRRINQITCRVLSGKQEWLGTHFGVKVIDTNTGKVVHYTSCDGLPGDYIEDIAADRNHVFCIVRVGSESAFRIALCVLDAKSGKWKTLQEVKPLMVSNQSSDSWNQQQAWQRLRGRSRLALNDQTLVFAPATVGRASDTVFYTLNVATQVIHKIGWDPNIQADNPILATSFVHLKDNHVYLGTNLGLFNIDLSPRPDSDNLWRRYLPSKVIDAGAVTANGEDIWLTVHDRAAEASPPENASLWNLASLNTKTGRITTVSFFDPSVERDLVTKMPRWASSVFPQALSIASDGAVWLSQMTKSRIYDGSDNSTRLYHYLPAKKQWGALALTTPPFDQYGKFSEKNLSVYNQVPDAIALSLAFDLNVGEQALMGSRLDYNSVSEITSPPPSLWVRMRFPRWFCPEGESLNTMPMGYIRDPANPSMIWFSADNALVHMAEADQPLWNSSSHVFTNDGQQNSPPASWYTYRGGQLAVRPQIEALEEQGENLIAHTPSGLFLLTDDAREWKPVYLPDNRGSFDALNNQIAWGGPEGAFLLRLWGEKETLKYFDAPSSSFVDSGTSAPSGATMIGANQQGGWFRSGDRKSAYFVPLSAKAQATGAVEKIEGNLPEEMAPPVAGRFLTVIGATGDTAWFLGSFRRSATDRYHSTDYPQVIVGYDHVQHRWTAPLELDPARGYDIVPFLGKDGATYIPRDDADTSVYRYDQKADRWEGVAPPLPTPTQLGDERSRLWPTLIAVNDQEIDMTDWRYLYRYDRKSSSWTYNDLPKPLQKTSNPFTIQWRTAQTKDGLWIGSEQGLWRFDTAKQSWEEKEFPLKLDASASKQGSESNGTASAFNLYLGAVDRHSIWGSVAPSNGEQSSFFRFDRASHQFTIYNQSTGVPVRGYRRMLSDGDGLWIITEDTTYRLDAKTGQATALFQTNATKVSRQETLAQEKSAQKPLPIGTVGTIEEDSSDPTIAYILLNTADRSFYPNDQQPAILYRFNKRSGALDPLPISASALAALPKQNIGEWSTARPPAISGTWTILSEPGKDLWVGTTAGVYRVNPASGVWQAATLPPGTPLFITFSISSTPTGVLIQGGRDTLRLVDKKEEKRTSSVSQLQKPH